MMGLSPAMLQGSYLVHPDAVDFAGHKGPSTPMACEICAGIAATQALQILLERGTVQAAPWAHHYDPYLNRLKKTWRPGGNRNPLQKIGIAIARWRLKNMRQKT